MVEIFLIHWKFSHVKVITFFQIPHVIWLQHNKILGIKSLISYENNIDVYPDITEEELLIAVYSYKKNKAPGPDGLQAFILQNFHSILNPYLLRVFQACL